MRAVLKYKVDPLHGRTRVSFLIPKGAEPVEVHEQHGAVHMWVLADPSAPLTERTFQVVGTGHLEVPDDAVHIGTAHLSGGVYVFHIFEVTP